MQNDMQNDVKCVKCGNEEVLYTAKNYPKNSSDIWFCSKECLKSWLVRHEITFCLTGIIGIIIAACLTFANGVYDLAAQIIVMILWTLVAFVLRKMVGFLFGGHYADGNEEAMGFALKGVVIVLAALTIVLPVIWIVREVKQFVKLNKILKQPEIAVPDPVAEDAPEEETESE